ncbi:Hypothetical Protein FCC1311_062872 [Hondaea fermentalgiana]|uniref:Uncharacterized protein n=1 Tax=Hondaea fermentalgiana TaxID=2315210 RepID=A0A2R5GGR4_9STRA|nr:Hypothetical Protein FCC1311_062872 [Hondaea fermentalgiana]|eukprot:GBG30067.1 Hypothetical Protein FCC1311_062872 [Hondaea fermentalgiana]
MTDAANGDAEEGSLAPVRSPKRWLARRRRRLVWPQGVAADARGEVPDDKVESMKTDATSKEEKNRNEAEEKKTSALDFAQDDVDDVFTPALVEIGNVAGAFVFVDNGRVYCVPESHSDNEPQETSMAYFLADNPTPFAGSTVDTEAAKSSKRPFPSFGLSTSAQGANPSLYFATVAPSFGAFSSSSIQT